LAKQIKSIEQDIDKILASDNFVSDIVKIIKTMPGISTSTIVGVIAETGGFVNIKSIKQLTSYSGYDVSIQESGKWKGKSSISKKGNSYIRRLMHMPTLSSIRSSESHKSTYNRIIENKEHKMVGVVAMQRRILGLIYTLWKNDSEYIEDYQKKLHK
jgi:transposase